MRILLAEDELDLARALEVIFKHNNYSIDVVNDGELALDYALTSDYDAIILDIMMPKRDGLSVLKELRYQNIKTPVLLLTAKSEIDDKVLGLDTGADDYLTKPFSSRELLARVRVLLRRGNDNVISANLTFGNTLLDLTSFVAKTNKNNVTLTSKEFQVLQKLFMNPGVVVSIEELMDKIWGIDSDAFDNVVWVNISYLRKKLSLIESNVVIKSKRNLGYYVEVKND